MTTMTCGRAGAAGAAGAGAGSARARGFGRGAGGCGVVEARVADGVLVADEVGTAGDAVLVVTSALVDVDDDGVAGAGRSRDEADEEGAPVPAPRRPSNAATTAAVTAARTITNSHVEATFERRALRAWRGAFPAVGTA